MAEGPDGVRARTVLEEERDFFLRSLRDLEAERAAGDIDEADYTALRDDYTARAADVLRQLEAAPAEPTAGRGAPVADPDAPRPGRIRRAQARGRTTVVVGVGGVVLVLAGITWAASAAAGVRLPGDGVSGGTSATQIDGLLAAAQTAVGDSQPMQAVKDYEQVIAADPANAEALTGEGQVLVQTGQDAGRPELVDLGEARLARAEKVAPTYAVAWGTLGEVLFAQGRYADAVPQLEAYLRLAPRSTQVPTVGRELGLARSRAARG